MELPLVLMVVAAALVVRLGYSWYLQGRSQLAPEPDPVKGRQEACEEVVHFCSDHLGYAARLAVSRQELQAAIAAGASPDSLIDLITDRLEGLPGVNLGRHGPELGSLPVKLPESYNLGGVIWQNLS